MCPVADILIDEFLTVSNRQNIDEKRAKFLLDSVAETVEHLTRRAFMRGTYSDTYPIQSKFNLIILSKNPVHAIQKVYVNSYEISDFSVVNYLDTQALVLNIWTPALVHVIYDAGYYSTSISQIPYALREVVYYITDYYFEKFTAGTVGVKARQDIGLVIATELDDFIKKKLLSFIL